MYKKVIALLLGGASLSVSAQIEYPGTPITGTAEIVYDYSNDACASDFSMDGAAHAYRGLDGDIRLIVPNHELYAFKGPDFDNLTPDCSGGKVFTSDVDPSQANHNYKEWMGAPYTEDGVNFYTLVHNEYHGYDFSGQCGHADVLKCWYNSITFASSSDTGKTFSHVTAPNHLVASIPYRYDKDHGYRQGAFNPSNIIKHRTDGYYYAFFHTEEIGLQEDGLVAMRTATLTDPSSWRMYDGSGWNTESINPYLSSSYDTTAHVFHVLNGTKSVGGVYYSTYYEQYIMIFHSRYEIDGGMKEGMCFSLSEDLINWSTKKMIYYVNQSVNSSTENNSWDYGAYPSLIDHNDTTRNFSEIGETAYLYYTKWIDPSNPGLPNRDLIRVPITFTKNMVSGFTVVGTGNQEDTNPGDGVCETPAGNCSFYAAIMESNARMTKHSDSILDIDFNMGSRYINATAGAGYIPTSNYPVNIDGTTNQSATENTALMDDTINTYIGVRIGLGGNPGLSFTGGNTSIKGLCISNPQSAAIGFSGKGNNIVTGCFLGTSIAGTANQSEANDGWGVVVDNVPNVTIGGSDAADRNLILGGIQIKGSGATNAVVKGNFIGTDVTGTVDLEESEHGIGIGQGATGVVIGGSTLAERNVISGNNRGINIESGCDDNVITNNYIGVSMDGTIQLGNNAAGVSMASDGNDLIGNVIGNSGAGEAGLWLDGDNNTIQSNFFGTDPTEGVNHANNGAAIVITSGGQDNMIGGYLTAEANVIANSNTDGIATFSGNDEGNSFLGNKIYNNNQYGIDIGADDQALTENIVDFSLAALRNDSLFVSGECSGTANSAYRIEFFSNPSCDGDGYGEGQTFIGYATTLSDDNGDLNFSESFTGAGVSDGEIITALATNGNGSTNEFNLCMEVGTGLPTFDPDSTQIRQQYVAGQTGNVQVTISNGGGVELEWSVSKGESWLSLGQPDGNVFPFDAESYQFNFDANGLSGTYYDTLVFISNDPYKSNILIPVEFSVVAPVAETSDDTVFYAMQPNRTEEVTVYLKNTGTGDLTFSAGMGPGADILGGINPNSGTVAEGDSIAVKVTMRSNGRSPDVYNDFVWFSTNDPNQGVHEIQFETTVDLNVSTNELIASNDLSIKVQGNDLIIVSAIGFDFAEVIEIYNVNGQLIKTWTGMENKNELLVTISQFGTYYLKISSNNKSQTIKIIK